MMTGVVTLPDSRTFQCAFLGLKSPGYWILEYQKKGFSGAHGSRHIYNLQGGNVYELDLLLTRRDEASDGDTLEFRIPSTERNV